MLKATSKEAALKTETQCATASTDHITNIVTDGTTTSMDLDEDLNFVDACRHLGASPNCACCCCAARFPPHCVLTHRPSWQTHIHLQECGCPLAFLGHHCVWLHQA